MSDLERVVFVYTAYPSLVEAETAGRALVERRLGARSAKVDTGFASERAPIFKLESVFFTRTGTHFA